MAIDLDQIRPKVPATRKAVHGPDNSVQGYQLIITCPYCGQTHYHGDTLGPRNSHCTTDVRVRRRMVPSDAHGNPGYELCNPTDAVDWDAERALAQLWVARAAYRRITDHLDRDYPVRPRLARDRRAREELERQAETLASVLNAAGVSL